MQRDGFPLIGRQTPLPGKLITSEWLIGNGNQNGQSITTAPLPFSGCDARQTAYFAFFAALTLAQRARAAAAILRRAARLMVRFLGAALAFFAAPRTLAQRARAAAAILRRAPRLMVRFLGDAFPAGEELAATA